MFCFVFLAALGVPVVTVTGKFGGETPNETQQKKRKFPGNEATGGLMERTNTFFAAPRKCFEAESASAGAVVIARSGPMLFTAKLAVVGLPLIVLKNQGASSMHTTPFLGCCRSGCLLVVLSFTSAWVLTHPG